MQAIEQMDNDACEFLRYHCSLALPLKTRTGVLA